MTTEKQSANEGVISEAVLDELMLGYEKPEGHCQLNGGG